MIFNGDVIFLGDPNKGMVVIALKNKSVEIECTSYTNRLPEGIKVST